MQDRPDNVDFVDFDYTDWNLDGAQTTWNNQAIKIELPETEFTTIDSNMRFYVTDVTGITYQCAKTEHGERSNES